MLPCNQIDLSAYHDRALGEDVLRQIDIHLQYCANCMTRYGHEVKLVSSLADLPRVDPPKHFIPHVMFRVRQEIYSRINPEEERRFSVLTAGYSLALLTLIFFLGGLQRAFLDATLGWAQFPLKSVWAVMRTMNTVAASGSVWLSASGPVMLSGITVATVVAGFMLIKLLTQYERRMIEDAQVRVRRGGDEKIL